MCIYMYDECVIYVINKVQVLTVLSSMYCNILNYEWWGIMQGSVIHMESDSKYSVIKLLLLNV